MDAPYVVRNSLRYAFRILRAKGRFLDESSRSNFEQFYLELTESLNVTRKADPLTNSMVESFYSGRMAEDGFLKCIEMLVLSKLSAGGAADVCSIHQLVWESYSRAKIKMLANFSRVPAPVCVQWLWEISLRLDKEEKGFLHADDACHLIKKLCKANGRKERASNIREWFCEAEKIDFFSFISAVLEKYPNFLKLELVQDLHGRIVNEVLMKGMLTKKGHRMPSWKDRWFVLTRSSLTYYESEQNQIQKGVISINENAQVLKLPDIKGHKFLFRLMDGATKVPTDISTPSRSILEEWVYYCTLAIKMNQVKGRNFLSQLSIASKLCGVISNDNIRMRERRRTSLPDITPMAFDAPSSPPPQANGTAAAAAKKGVKAHKPLGVSQSFSPETSPPPPLETSPPPPLETSPLPSPPPDSSAEPGLQRRRKKKQGGEQQHDLRRRHSSIMKSDDLSPNEIKHFMVGAGDVYAVVDKAERPTHQKQQHQPPPVIASTRDGRGYIKLDFNTHQAKDSPSPKQVRTKFAYSKIVFSQEEAEKPKARPQTPPKYEGRGMPKKNSSNSAPQLPAADRSDNYAQLSFDPVDSSNGSSAQLPTKKPTSGNYVQLSFDSANNNAKLPLKGRNVQYSKVNFQQQGQGVTTPTISEDADLKETQGARSPLPVGRRVHSYEVVDPPLGSEDSDLPLVQVVPLPGGKRFHRYEVVDPQIESRQSDQRPTPAPRKQLS